MNTEIIKKDVEEAIVINSNVIVKSQEDYLSAGDAVKLLKNKIRNIEAKRVEYTKPLLDQKKLIDDDFKKMITPLKDLVGKIESTMLDWHRAEQKRLDDEQRKIEEEAMKKMKEKKQEQVIIPVVNEIKAQRTDFSTSIIQKRWTWKLEDESKVPREYLMINEAKIREAIRAGKLHIDGINIYQEEKIVTR